MHDVSGVSRGKEGARLYLEAVLVLLIADLEQVRRAGRRVHAVVGVGQASADFLFINK
jgi:hypothetical protein